MAAYKYEFSIKGYHKVDAQTVGEMIENMSESGIEVTPEVLLDASRDESSPTHCEFEWDDSVAAEQYRIEQARRIIAHIRIVREDGEEHEYTGKEYNERGFVPIPGGRNVYVPLQKALGNEEYKNFLLKQAENDMQVFLAKYRRVEQLAKVTTAMQEYLGVS